MGSDFNGEKEQRRKYHSAESLLRVVGVGGGRNNGRFFAPAQTNRWQKTSYYGAVSIVIFFETAPFESILARKSGGGGRNEKKTFFFYLRLVSVILVNNLDPSVNSFTIVLLLMVILKSAHPTVLYIKYFESVFDSIM